MHPPAACASTEPPAHLLTHPPTHHPPTTHPQVRGSIPLLWSQAPNLKYKIPIRIAPPSRQEAVFAAHARDVVDGYKVSFVRVCVWVGGQGRRGAGWLQRLPAVPPPRCAELRHTAVAPSRCVTPP